VTSQPCSRSGSPSWRRSPGSGQRTSDFATPTRCLLTRRKRHQTPDRSLSLPVFGWLLQDIDTKWLVRALVCTPEVSESCLPGLLPLWAMASVWLVPLEARPPCTSWPCRTRPSASGAYRLPKAVAVRPCRLALMLVPRGGVMRATDRRCLASCLCTGFLVAPVVAIAPAVLAAPPAGRTVVSAVLADAVQGCRDWDYSCGYRRGVRQARSDAGKDCGSRHRHHDDRSTTTRSEDGYSKGYLDGSLAYCPPAGNSDETFPYNP
jgi:hypothetical protein